MKKIINISIVSSIIILVQNAYSQSNCANALAYANKSYETGDFSKSISELLPCLKSGLPKDEQMGGYRLLALSYLALNDPADARKATENMLELNPLYKADLLKDPKDFINLVNSTTINPRSAFGLTGSAGFNYSYVNVIQRDNEFGYAKKYSGQIGSQFGLGLQYNISSEITTGVGLNASFKNYSNNYSANDFYITDNEHLSFLEVPLYFSYVYGKKKLKPFVRLGEYEDFLLNASSEFDATYQANKSSYTFIDANSNYRRNNIDFGLLGAFGFNWKFDPSWQLSVAYSYTYGLTNIINNTHRYSDQNLIYNYFYVDDDLKINNSIFTIGVVRSLNYKVIRN